MLTASWTPAPSALRRSDDDGRRQWVDIDFQPIDVTCTLPEEELVRSLTHLGPLGRTLATMDVSTRARAAEAVRPAFDPYVVLVHSVPGGAPA